MPERGTARGGAARGGTARGGTARGGTARGGAPGNQLSNRGRRPAVLLVRGGTVVDAAGGTERTRRADVLVEDGRVTAVEAGIAAPGGATVLDAGGCFVMPGLVDLHTHLRQPGAESAETIETGTRAAALGGYTAVVAMPNTDPPIDHAGVVREVLELGRGVLAEVAVAGAITVGRLGGALAPIGEMAELGVRLFTDDGRGVQDGGLLRRALEYAGPLGVVLAEHCEDESLAAGGSMNEGAWSSRLGIPGQPALAEEAMLARDLALVRLTGSPMHFLHLSTAGSLRLLAEARAAGSPVTAEVTPHHLSLSEDLVASYDPVFKVNPPLRTTADVEALRRGLASGLIDAVATDHAPHPQEAKEEPFELAPSGMLGLETALSICWEVLCALAGTGEHETAATVVERMSTAPARIARLEHRHGSPSQPGRPANLCVFDPSARWRVEPHALASRSRNTPFAGRAMIGRVRHTVLAGEPVVLDGEAQR